MKSSERRCDYSVDDKKLVQGDCGVEIGATSFAIDVNLISTDGAEAFAPMAARGLRRKPRGVARRGYYGSTGLCLEARENCGASIRTMGQNHFRKEWRHGRWWTRSSPTARSAKGFVSPLAALSSHPRNREGLWKLS